MTGAIIGLPEVFGRTFHHSCCSDDRSMCRIIPFVALRLMEIILHLYVRSPCNYARVNFNNQASAAFPCYV